ELRQHRDGAGRRVDPALRLGRRHALHAMHAGLELEPRVRALADDPADDLLVSAVLAFARAQHLDAPALVLGVSAVHPKEIAGEKRRLVAAGPGADLEEQVRVVDRKSTRLNSSHVKISYAVFCLKKKKDTRENKHDTDE